MNKKVFVISMLTILFMIFMLSKSKQDNIDIKGENYSKGTIKTAVKYLKEKANNSSITNYENGNKGEMYTFNHDATNQTTALTDYRYIGDNPNNYVYFNCGDANDTTTCEVWRIIGVFNVEDENGSKEERIKIIRDVPLEEKYRWIDYEPVGADPGVGVNDWTITTLNTYLNAGDYWNSLSDTSKQMIGNTKFYLGAREYFQGYSTGIIATASDLYNIERNNRVYTDHYEWVGNVALMYPSDFYYTYGLGVNDKCYSDVFNCNEGISNKSWLFNNLNDVTKTINHMITPWNDSVFSIAKSSDEGLGNLVLPGGYGSIIPVTYLKNDILIKNGDGTKNNPYKLQTKEDYLNQDFEYKVGDKVLYNNEVYYVLYDSAKDSDYVTVLKDIPLTKKYTDYFDEKAMGFAPFYKSDKCYYETNFLYDYTGCKIDYDSSTVKKIVDSWSAKELDLKDLVSVDGYKARLIKSEELLTAFKMERSIDVSNKEYLAYTEESPDFIKTIPDSIWTMSSAGDGDLINTISGRKTKVYYENGVLPVINLRKSSIGTKNKYKIGDEITYKNSNYYVINASSSDVDYVTVIKEEPLNKKQVMLYGNLAKQIGKHNYNDCVDNNCVLSYDNSNAKKIVDYWIQNNFDDEDLKEVDGYKGRLIRFEELMDDFYYEYSSYEINSNRYTNLLITENTPKWIYNYSYWTMTAKEDSNNQVFVVNNDDINSVIVSTNFTIRPIIYLKKSAINKIRLVDEDVIDSSDGNKCTIKYKKKKIIRYDKYNIGQEVDFNNEKYYVISNSDESLNYVTLLKKEFLKDSNTNEILKTAYYTSDDCIGRSGCKNNYDESKVKEIINKWVNDKGIENDLISVDGYKARLINASDLFNNLGYNLLNIQKKYVRNITYGYVTSYTIYLTDENTPSWIYDNQNLYWTMMPGDYPNLNYVVSIDGNLQTIDNENCTFVYNSYAIRPVINLNKCSINGCHEEEIEIADGCIEDGNSIVDVASTLSVISKFIIIISLLLIISGIGILGYNYYKSINERKKHD